MRTRIYPLVILSFLFTSCVYTPLSRSFYKWSSEVCGRKTFMERLCSGAVLGFMLPVYIGALLLDIPLSILEFFFGVAPFKDPLIKTASNDFEPRTFPGNQPEEEWVVQRLRAEVESFQVQKRVNGKVTEEYVMTPMEGGQLKIYAPSSSLVAQRIPVEYRYAELPESWTRSY